MSLSSSIELKDLVLDTQIGTYGPGSTAPDRHVLDLALSIDPALVLIEKDGMAHVFDYDPLVSEIVRLARAVPYETQESLMTRIAHACAACPQVQAVNIALRKSPLHAGTGSLGVRLIVAGTEFDRLRPPG